MLQQNYNIYLKVANFEGKEGGVGGFKGEARD
jgi:hypothetical protein